MKTALNTLLKLTVSASLLYYLALQTDLEGLGAAFAATVPSLFLLAVAFFVVSNGLGACQWFLLLRAHRLPIGFRQATVFYLTGVFFNNVLLGNIGGDALRIYDVRRLTGRTSGAAAATFMDRFVGLLSTCSLALIACLAVAEVRVPGVISVLVPAWAALVLLLAMGLSGRVGRLLEGLATRILPDRAGRKAASLRRSMAVYRDKGWLLLGVWAVSLGVQFARVLVYWSAGLAAGAARRADLLPRLPASRRGHRRPADLDRGPGGAGEHLRRAFRLRRRSREPGLRYVPPGVRGRCRRQPAGGSRLRRPPRAADRYRGRRRPVKQWW